MGNIKTLVSFIALLLTLSTFAHKRPALEYVQNIGQWDGNALYRVGMGGGAIFLEEDCFTFHFVHGDDRASMHDFSQWSPEQQAVFNMRGHAWKMHFEDALEAQVSGEKKAEHYYNYFHGNDQSKWASNVGIYEAVTYDDIYEGVDIRCYNRASNFKYDFILDPGVDPNVIDLRFEGLDGLSVEDGKLVLQTAIGDFKEMSPYSYQLKNEKLVEVPCDYVVMGDRVSFHFPEGYDSAYRLIIDPELIAATLSGTNGDDNYGHTATFDLTGIIYTGCISFGVGYPATTGSYDENYNSGAGGWGTDIAISKLTADGTDLIWASYLGGGEGDYPHSIVANDLGEVFVYGSTTATDYPTTPGAFQEDHNGDADIIITHFSSDGSSLIGSTYMGGNMSDGRNMYATNYGDTYRGEIILDEAGRPLIASFSSSEDFPTSINAYQSDLSGGQDAVVFRMNALLTNLEACTMLGSSENDSGYGVRVTASGDIYLAGTAGAMNFPLTIGAYQTEFLGGGDEWSGEADGFVAKLNSTCTTLEASTLLGTTMPDQIFFIDLDNDENVFVFGQGGVDIPMVGDVYGVPDSRQFITKFNHDLTNIMLSTQIGAGGGDAGFTDFVPIAFLVDHCNNIYISGHGASTWGGVLPLTGDALYDGTNGEAFYLAVLSEDLEDLEFGTMYTSNHVDGGTSRFDKNGTVYQAVCSGGDFATTADAWAPNQSTGWDIGVFKIDFDVSGVNAAITGSDVNGCAPFEVVFQNFSVGDIFEWDFGDGGTSDEFEPSYIYEEPGSYTISLIASDLLSCNLADTSYFDIQISVPTDFVPEFTWTSDCETLGISTNNLTDVEWLDYLWDMGDGTVLEGYDVDYNYEEPGTYLVSLLAIDNGCMEDEEIAYEVTIFDQVVAVIENDDESGCAPLEINFNNTSSGQIFTWDFGDGSAPEVGNNIVHVFNEPGDYIVTLTAEGTGDCSGTSMDEILVEVIAGPVITPNFLVNQVDDCELKTVQIENLSEGPDLEYWWDMGDGATYSGQNPDHIYDEPGTYTITLTISEPTCNQDQIMTVDVQVIEALDMELPPDITMCHYDEGVMLNGANLGLGATYEWSNGETTQSIFVTEPGAYTLEGTTNNCTGSDEIIVSQSPQINTDHTITACEGTQAYLQVPYDGSSEYNWCQGEAAQFIYADSPGDYCFQFIDDLGCLQEGNIHLVHINHDADLYIPNTFTPNNDGVNDVFQPVGTEVRDFEFSVWNRWGDVVFETEEQGKVWDGSHNGSDHYIQDGIYPFRVAYNGTCSAEKIVKSGFITVIR